VPNYFVDGLARLLPGPHFKALIFLVRKIAGWHKDSDLISLSQIQNSAGVSRKVAEECLQVFQRIGIIGKRRGMGPRGINKIFLIRKVNPGEVTSRLHELVEKGKNGRLRFTLETRSDSRSELRLVHRVNTQKERVERIGKDGATAPPHSPVTGKLETEPGMSEFFREFARIAGKKAMP
jgi:hypothetical protein